MRWTLLLILLMSLESQSCKTLVVTCFVAKSCVWSNSFYSPINMLMHIQHNEVDHRRGWSSLPFFRPGFTFASSMIPAQAVVDHWSQTRNVGRVLLFLSLEKAGYGPGSSIPAWLRGIPVYLLNCQPCQLIPSMALEE